jgi:hypothetical protein
MQHPADPPLACRCNISDLRRDDTEAKTSPLDRLFAPQRASLHPYGVDPVFLSSSQLYDAKLGAQAQLYYNTSSAAGEVSATGTPYGFFARSGVKVSAVAPT